MHAQSIHLNGAINVWRVAWEEGGILMQELSECLSKHAALAFAELLNMGGNVMGSPSNNSKTWSAIRVTSPGEFMSRHASASRI